MPIDRSYYSIRTQIAMFERAEREIREKYKGKIVVFQDGEVLGVGDSIDEALIKIQPNKLKNPLYIAT